MIWIRPRLNIISSSATLNHRCRSNLRLGLSYSHSTGNIRSHCARISNHTYALRPQSKMLVTMEMLRFCRQTRIFVLVRYLSPKQIQQHTGGPLLPLVIADSPSVDHPFLSQIIVNKTRRSHTTLHTQRILRSDTCPTVIESSRPFITQLSIKSYTNTVRAVNIRPCTDKCTSQTVEIPFFRPQTSENAIGIPRRICALGDGNIGTCRLQH
jgi:hypothetical protein